MSSVKFKKHINIFLKKKDMVKAKFSMGEKEAKEFLSDVVPKALASKKGDYEPWTGRISI